MAEWIISSSVLIGIVTALRQILKGRISLRLQYAMWLIVLVRLLIPVSIFDSGISVMNAAREVRTVQYAEGVSEYEDIRKTSDGTVEGYHRTDFLNDMPVVIDTGVTDAEFDRMETVLTAREVFTAIWLCGAAVVLLTFIISNARFSRKLRATRQTLYIPESFLPVYMSSRVYTPCMYGLFAPKIYVTHEAAANERTLSPRRSLLGISALRVSCSPLV